MKFRANAISSATAVLNINLIEPWAVYYYDISVLVKHTFVEMDIWLVYIEPKATEWKMIVI